MEEQAPPRTPFRFKLDPTVSVMDIITVLVIGGPLLVWGGGVNTRVEYLERQYVELRNADREAVVGGENLKKEFREDIRGLREDLREINRKLDALAERVPPRR